ncbi:MAG: hypothetical protein WBE93_09185, partial [Pseudolabrys sp.]
PDQRIQIFGSWRVGVAGPFGLPERDGIRIAYWQLWLAPDGRSVRLRTGFLWAKLVRIRPIGSDDRHCLPPKVPAPLMIKFLDVRQPPGMQFVCMPR